MIYVQMTTHILVVYILAAILPAIILMGYVYRHDTVEKEPPRLLGTLLLWGVAAALCSIVLEMIGQTILDAHFTPASPYYHILMAFLVVSAVEEGVKLFVLKRRTWNDPNFNYLFDGVVYSVFVSLGFAAFENIQYVFSYGLWVALVRAFSSVPGHLGFAVFMGVFYGRARLFENRGEPFRRKTNMVGAYLSSVFLHGFYDACAMIGSGLATVMFWLFVIVMYVIVYCLLKKASQTDHAI